MKFDNHASLGPSFYPYKGCSGYSQGQRNICESGTILINTYQWPADGKTYEDYIGKQYEDQQLVCKVPDDRTNEKTSSFLSGDVAIYSTLKQ